MCVRWWLALVVLSVGAVADLCRVTHPPSLQGAVACSWAEFGSLPWGRVSGRFVLAPAGDDPQACSAWSARHPLPALPPCADDSCSAVGLVVGVLRGGCSLRRKAAVVQALRSRDGWPVVGVVALAGPGLGLPPLVRDDGLGWQVTIAAAALSHANSVTLVLAVNGSAASLGYPHAAPAVSVVRLALGTW